MSQFSKVSPVLRQQILNTILPGMKVSNAFLENATQKAFSLRKIQEATQKLTQEGTLVKVVEWGITYYSINTANTNAAAASAGVSSVTTDKFGTIEAY